MTKGEAHRLLDLVRAGVSEASGAEIAQALRVTGDAPRRALEPRDPPDPEPGELDLAFEVLSRFRGRS